MESGRRRETAVAPRQSGSTPVRETARELAGNGLTHREARSLIRDDIVDARHSMSETLDQLAERLNPNRVKRQLTNEFREATIGRVKTMARDTADRIDDTRASMMDTIRDNPIPAAMAAMGLGWLLMNRSRSGSGRRMHDERARSSGREWATYGSQASSGTARGLYAPENMAERPFDDNELWRDADEAYQGGTSRRMSEDDHGAVDAVKDKVRDATDSVRDGASHATDAVRDRTMRAKDVTSERAQQAADRARHMATEAKERALRAERQVERSYFENPLAIGAAAAALGFIAGMSVPSTEVETELMGDARDRLVDRARDEFEDVKQVAQDVGSRAMDEAKQELGG